MKSNISPLTGFGSLPAFRNTFQFCSDLKNSQLREVEEDKNSENFENYEDKLNHMRDTTLGDTKYKKDMLKRKTIWDQIM